MSILTDILGAIGLTGDIAESVTIAMATPTSANIQEVVNAYARNAQVPPTKLMAYLIQENESRYPNDLYRGAIAPWLIGAAIGGVLLFSLFSKRRG